MPSLFRSHPSQELHFPSERFVRGFRGRRRTPVLGLTWAAAVALATANSAVVGQTFTWNGSTSNDPKVAANWTGPTVAVPGASNIVLFDNTTPNAVPLSAGTSGAWSVAGIRVTSGTGLVSTSSVLAQGYFDIGSSGIDMSSATRDLTLNWISISANQQWNVAAGRTLTLPAAVGISAAAGRTVTLAGSGTFSSSNYLAVGGNSANGVIQHTGGTLVANGSVPIYIGLTSTAAGFSGIYNLSGGTVALAGTQPILISQGGFSNGQLNVSGSGQITSSGTTTVLRVGDSGVGSYSQTGGSVTIGTFNVGSNNATGYGTAVFSGGTMTASALQVGTAGTAAASSFSLSGSGILNLGGVASVGSATAGTSGTLTLGGTTNFTSTSAGITRNTTGVVIADGAVLRNAVQSGSVGTVTIAAPMEIRSGNLTLFSAGGVSGTTRHLWATGSLSGTGKLIAQGAGAGDIVLTGSNSFSGGIDVVSGILATGSNSVPVGTAMNMVGNWAAGGDANLSSLTGSGLIFGGDGLRTITVGLNNASSTFDGRAAAHSIVKVGSGTLTLTGSMGLAGNASRIQAGTLQIGNGGTTGELPALITNDATLVFNRSNSLTHASVISGSGQVIKRGAGVLTLTAANTYTGATTIAGGTLALGVNGSLANSSLIVVGDAGSLGTVLDLTAKTAAFSIAAGQTLSGGGTVLVAPGQRLEVQGTFSPGNSPGLFTFDGGTTVLSGTSVMEIMGTSRATLPSHGSGFYDAVNVVDNGILQFGGTLSLSFSSLFDNDASFALFTPASGGSLSGNFSGVTVTGGFYNGLTWSQAGSVWKSSNTTGNQSLEFSSATGQLVIVPEPNTMVFAGIGIAMAGWSLWKRGRIRSV